MTERTCFLAPSRMALAIARVFGHSIQTIIYVEEEQRGKVKEIAHFIQDFGDRFSGNTQ